ncbi:plasmid mobilization protein [Cupriavidus sp. D39]|uniref:plasmid mobilization protein n=1 Tax=Cupriavidus sp. D39 TaxID=2997877 RepID=UPI00226EE70E|nr:hypothetical protein [Cupriavidus sp. D39]MCY0852996.1 hypothetical protein [Cupriavidus sp. D39]
MAFAKVDNPKTEICKLRVTKDEKAALLIKADECSMPLSEYLLAAGLKRQTRGRADVDAINLLREIAAGLKALHEVADDIHEEHLQRALDEVVQAIQRVWSEGARR